MLLVKLWRNSIEYNPKKPYSITNLEKKGIFLRIYTVQNKTNLK